MPLVESQPAQQSSTLIDRVSIWFPPGFDLRMLLLPVALLLLAAASLQWWLGAESDLDESTIPTVTSLSVTQSSGSSSSLVEAEPPLEIVVHVAGEVQDPGVIRLPAGSRIAEAIEAAGGATSQADVHRLNLAQTLYDGTSIAVPAHGEEAEGPTVREQVQAANPEQGGASPGSRQAATGSANKVNINSADTLELQGLKGVGPATADAIVDWRSTNGPFQTVEQLLAVPGIGPAKLAAMSDGVIV